MANLIEPLSDVQCPLFDFRHKQELAMTANTKSDTNPQKTNDAATNALARETTGAPDEVPVKQHNPGGKGINPDQKGPAQPSESGTDSKRQ
jgi:hypothetical protein